MWLLDLEGLGNVLGIGSGVRLGCGAKKAQGMARLYTSGWGLTHVLLMLKIGYIFFHALSGRREGRYNYSCCTWATSTTGDNPSWVFIHWQLDNVS